VRLRYLSVARLEFRDAIAWYRARSVGAARHLNEEVVVAEKLLAQHPRIGKRVEAEARSLCVNDFTYTRWFLISHEVQPSEISLPFKGRGRVGMGFVGA
jgi:plasmid stabilization system protein ParE